MWYTPSELESIRQKCRDIVSSLGPGDLRFGGVDDENDGDNCLRGLECYFESQETKRRACYAVQCVQTIQMAEGLDDPDEIARVYRRFTASGQRKANIRGVQDQDAALFNHQHSHDNSASDSATRISSSAGALSFSAGGKMQTSRRGRLERIQLHRGLHAPSLVDCSS